MDTQTSAKDIYKSSRVMYIIWALADCLIATLTSGVYLAKLTTTIGISDGMTAILSTVTSLAGGFQIISIFLAHKTPVKRWSVPVELFFRLMLSGLYLVPFLSLKGKEDVVIFIILLSSCALREIILPVTATRFMNLLPVEKIGSFSALNMCISLVGTICFTFLMGTMVDRYEAKGDMNSAFLILTLTIFALSLICVLCLAVSREKKAEDVKAPSALSEVKVIVKNKKFVISIILLVLWTFVQGCVTPFLGTYQINELGLSMTLISVFSVVSSSVRILFTYLFGKLSERRPMLMLLKIGYVSYLLSFVFIIFANPKNGVVMFLFYLLISQIGVSAQAVGNTIIYSIVSTDQRTTALALRSICSGVAAMLVTLSVTPLFNYVKETLGGELFGITVYAQQVLALVSIVLGIPFLIFVFSGKVKILEHTSVD